MNAPTPENGEKYFKLDPLDINTRVRGIRVTMGRRNGAVIPNFAYIVVSSINPPDCTLSFYKMVEGEVIPEPEEVELNLNQPYEIRGVEARMFAGWVKRNQKEGYRSHYRLVLMLDAPQLDVFSEKQWREREFSPLP